MIVQESRDGDLKEMPRHNLLRLERNNREILSLKENLRSYTCEPKTPSLFDRYERLKSQLDSMRKKNSDLIEGFFDRKLGVEEQLNKIREQLQAFKQLELQVLEYIGMARMHA